jgi:hypothetical protein
LLARPLTEVTRRLNPHSPRWNSAVSKVAYAVSFLLAYIAKSYIAAAVRQGRTAIDLSVPAFFTLVTLFFGALICGIIAIESIARPNGRLSR